MDDRIIDFNKIKNKANDKDVDKLENYMYSLYYEMAEGKITMADFTKKMYEYMDNNNISQDKFFNMQKKLMERYGFDAGSLEEQLKNAGINISAITPNYDEVRKTMSFQDKYGNSVVNKSVINYKIKNDKNDLVLMLEEENVIIESAGKVNLDDVELNEFLCSYKKIRDNKVLKIKVYENVNQYDY